MWAAGPLVNIGYLIDSSQPLRSSEQAQRLATALQAHPALPPSTAAARLKQELERQYDLHLDWEESSWEEASSAASAAGKALFVYLHSPTHEDTERFVQGTLKDPSIALLLSQHFLLWAGSIHDREAFALAAALGATRFPFAALLAFPLPR